MKPILLFISLFLLPSCLVTALHESDYDFHKILDADGKYELYWSFDLEQENISFAVRVQTTGWIGFGLSPNGQMPNSDVVIGWVDADGKGYLQDRFADDRVTPPIDEQQDWTLTGAEEQSGYTTLEFTRKLLTCDERDLEIKAETARVIWSYYPTDPDDASGPFSPHTEQGTRSINLLSVITEDNIPPSSDAQSFTLKVDNLLVPNETDTTYWCVSTTFSTPNNQRIYIHKFGPVIPKHAAAYVHHMTAFLCPLGHRLPHNLSSNCFDIGVFDVLNPCRSNEAIGGWAVGGEDFAFPEGIAFAVEGHDTDRYVLLEMHYDNPNLAGDVIDNSGLEFFYTTTPPKEEAGMLFVGSAVTPSMFIPPNADNFEIKSVCSADCLSQYLPENGIRVFANFMHTHLLGHGLTVHHFTSNEECGATEELKPLDQNLKYDFDFQQFVHLPSEVTVKPGDSLELTCYYRSSGSGRTGVTVGGLGTRDEMCLTSFYYYPRTNLSGCATIPDPRLTYQDFVTSNIEDSAQAELLFQAMENFDSYNVTKILNTVTWNADRVQELQDAVLGAPQWLACLPHSVEDISLESIAEYTQPASLHDPDCLYEAPNPCTASKPLSCCERLRQEQPLSPSSSPTPDGAGTLVTSVSTMLMFLGTAILSVF